MLAFAGGSMIFLAFVIVFLLAVVYAFFTRTGSGINQRPSDGRGGAPGAEGASRISSAEREH
ncbi:MAG: hypothetical protein ACJ762_15025 [Solirubrobacteraceae bacterium]